MSLMVMRPFSSNFSSTTSSFSIRFLCRSSFAWSCEMPSRQVIRSRVITSSTFCSRFFSKRRSRLVTMPTSRPLRVTGMPLMSCCRISSSAWKSRASGSMVTGSTTIPLSYFLTLVTSSACCAGDMFLWMNPIPPAWAMAMAVRASVTVSIAALTIGICRRRLRVSCALTSTWRGSTSLSAGSSRTSSNVRASGRFGSSISAPSGAASLASSLTLGNAHLPTSRPSPHAHPPTSPRASASARPAALNTSRECLELALWTGGGPPAPVRSRARPSSARRSGFGGAVAGGAASWIGLAGAAAGERGEGRRMLAADATPDERDGDPDDDDRQDDADDADLHFLGVLPRLAQHAVLPGPVAEQHPRRRRCAGGDAVVEEELPVRHAGGAGDEVRHRAHSGQEARHHDELRPVALEEADDAFDLLARDVPAQARLQQRLSVAGARLEDDRVADEDARQPDQDHQGQGAHADRRALPGQVAASDEGHVLRERQAQSARVAEPLAEVLRQRQHQLEAGLRLLLAQGLERAPLQHGELHVRGRQGGEQVLALCEEREVSQRIAGLQLAQRLPALADVQLERAPADEAQGGRRLAGAEGVGAAADRSLLAGLGEDPHADLAELAQEERSAQSGEAVHQAPRPCIPASLT